MLRKSPATNQNDYLVEYVRDELHRMRIVWAHGLPRLDSRVAEFELEYDQFDQPIACDLEFPRAVDVTYCDGDRVLLEDTWILCGIPELHDGVWYARYEAHYQ